MGCKYVHCLDTKLRIVFIDCRGKLHARIFSRIRERAPYYINAFESSCLYS